MELELFAKKKHPGMELREYQTAVLDKLQEAENRGVKSIMLQAATGAGKTVIASEVMRLATELGFKSLFLAHRRELIYQCADKLRRFGMPCGVIMAGEERHYDEPIQVASLQTLWVRGVRTQRMDLPDADLLLIDEAHRSCSPMYLELIKKYPNAVLLGLSATPMRQDGRGLGDIYQHMVLSPSVAELTTMGYLVPVRYFAPSKPDLTGVKITGGDYNEKELEERMDKIELIGDVVENWARIARDRKTVVFASGVRHSMHLKECFEKAGVRAAHIDGETPTETRKKILNDLENGDLQVLCNCMVLTEGWDSPSVSAAILARPTKSLVLYLQMAGRVVRPFPGKKDTLLIDHSGAVYEHGRIDEFTDWSLEKSVGKKLTKLAETRKRERIPIECTSCHALYFGQKHCPECGNIPVTWPKGVTYQDGYLRELSEEEKELNTIESMPRREFYSQLLGYAEEKGWKPGWAAFKYKEKYGNWPNSMAKVPKEACSEVRAWVRKQMDQWRANSAAEPAGEPAT